MELILLSVRLLYWLFVAPVWWVSTYIASYFYPFEGESGYLILSLVIAAIIITGAIVAFIAFA